MHSQHCLILSQRPSFLLPGPTFAANINRYQPLISPGDRPASVSASFATHGRNLHHSRAHSSHGPACGDWYAKRWWEASQSWVQQKWPSQGLRRVLLREHRLRTRPRSQADTEADSLEDLDLDDLDSEQIDDLFESYGELVKGESEPARASSEVDGDAESLALAVALAEVANDVKAGEIRVLCVKPVVYWTNFFVIATGFSRPQVDAIGQRMRNMAEERFKRTTRGDLKPNTWTLLDFGDVVVHIFYPKERAFYNLEEFYGNAVGVELPFESQSQMH